MTRDEANFDPEDERSESEARDADDEQFSIEPLADQDEAACAIGEELTDFEAGRSDLDPPTHEATGPALPSAAPSGGEIGASSNEPPAANEPASPPEDVPPLPGSAPGPAGHEPSRTGHGSGHVEHVAGSFGDAALPPFLQRAVEREAGSMPGPASTGGVEAASPSFVVEVRVDFTPEGALQTVEESTRAAREFSRKEIGIVAQRLHELNEEIRNLEENRRVIWDR